MHDRVPERIRPFEDVSADIKQRLTREMRDSKVEEFLDAERLDAVIKTAPQPKTPGKKKKSTTAFKSKKPLQSILVKPTGPDCNMRCRYCFYLKKEDLFKESKNHRMSEEVLEAMIRSALSGQERQINFGWQGGEPSLMGLPFYRRAVQFQK